MCVLLLPSCDLLPLATEVAADPVVAAGVKTAVGQAVAGEWFGAGYTIASLAAVAVGRWVHGRVKKSSPGEIIGGAS